MYSCDFPSVLHDGSHGSPWPEHLFEVCKSLVPELVECESRRYERDTVIARDVRKYSVVHVDCDAHLEDQDALCQFRFRFASWAPLQPALLLWGHPSTFLIQAEAPPC